MRTLQILALLGALALVLGCPTDDDDFASDDDDTTADDDDDGDGYTQAEGDSDEHDPDT